MEENLNTGLDDARGELLSMAVGQKLGEARKLIMQTAELMSEVMELCSGGDDDPGRDPIFQATALAMTALMGLHDVVLREGIEESAVIQ